MNARQLQHFRFLPERASLPANPFKNHIEETTP